MNLDLYHHTHIPCILVSGAMEAISHEKPKNHTTLSLTKYPLKDILSQETKNYFEDMNLLEDALGLIMITPPQKSIPLHTDVSSHGINDTPRGAFNVMLDDYDQWAFEYYDYVFTGKEPFIPSRVSSDIRYSTSKGYAGATLLDINKGKLIKSFTFKDKFSLIRVDVPHRIVNYGDQHRYSLSVRFKENNGYYNFLNKVNQNLGKVSGANDL